MINSFVILLAFFIGVYSAYRLGRNMEKEGLIFDWSVLVSRRRYKTGINKKDILCPKCTHRMSEHLDNGCNHISPWLWVWLGLGFGIWIVFGNWIVFGSWLGFSIILILDMLFCRCKKKGRVRK